MKFISTYHAQANGLVKRMQRQLNFSLTASDKRDWATQILWTIQQMKNSTDDIPYTPAEITFGGATRQPLNLSLNNIPVSIQQFASRSLHLYKFAPPIKGRWQAPQKPFMPKPYKLPTPVHICNPKKRPLQDAYAGPFKV